MLGAPVGRSTQVANERSRTVREQGMFANMAARPRLAELNVNEHKRTLFANVFTNISELTRVLSKTARSQPFRIDLAPRPCCSY